jgi:serine/threonine protein kinase
MLPCTSSWYCYTVDNLQELMTGGNVKQLLWKHMAANGGTVYTLEDGLDICLQMARGLKYLHSCQPMVRA